MRVQEASIPATTLYPGLVKKRVPSELDFYERLVSLRKECGLTQHTLADMVKMHISQEAASRLKGDDKNIVHSVIESIVLRNTFKLAESRFTATESGGTRL